MPPNTASIKNIEMAITTIATKISTIPLNILLDLKALYMFRTRKKDAIIVPIEINTWKIKNTVATMSPPINITYEDSNNLSMKASLKPN